MFDAYKNRLLEMSNGLYHNSQELKRVQQHGGELNLCHFKAGKKMDNQALHDHAVNTGAVLAGGGGVAGGTYVSISSLPIEHATQIASLAAGVATFFYFSVSAGYAAWKWYKEAYPSGSK
jgi:hypothetical protein